MAAINPAIDLSVKTAPSRISLFQKMTSRTVRKGHPYLKTRTWHANRKDSMAATKVTILAIVASVQAQECSSFAAPVHFDE